MSCGYMQPESLDLFPLDVCVRDIANPLLLDGDPRQMDALSHRQSISSCEALEPLLVYSHPVGACARFKMVGLPNDPAVIDALIPVPTALAVRA